MAETGRPGFEVCRHYDDLSFGQCRVGVFYACVRINGETDDSDRYPCFKEHNLAYRCSHALYEDDIQLNAEGGKGAHLWITLT
jgi:hypothetical protein